SRFADAALAERKTRSPLAMRLATGRKERVRHGKYSSRLALRTSGGQGFVPSVHTTRRHRPGVSKLDERLTVYPETFAACETGTDPISYQVVFFTATAGIIIKSVHGSSKKRRGFFDPRSWGWKLDPCQKRS